jgi:hypothetical protein
LKAEVKSEALTALIGGKLVLRRAMHGDKKAAQTGGKLGLRLAARTVSSQYFLLALPPYRKQGLPRLAPPQERQVDAHKPVLCGILRPVIEVFSRGQRIKFYSYGEGEFFQK